MSIRRHKKLVIFLCMLLIVAASGVAGYLIAESEPRVVAGEAEEEPVVEAGANDARITRETVITWDCEYEMCEHHVYVTAEPDEKMIGLGFTQFEETYPDVVIASFSPDEVVLKKRLECYCPSHYILKRNKDKLAVYRTTAGSGSLDVYRDVDVRFDALEKQQQEVLEKGRVFGSFDDLQSYLERISADRAID